MPKHFKFKNLSNKNNKSRSKKAFILYDNIIFWYFLMPNYSSS